MLLFGSNVAPSPRLVPINSKINASDEDIIVGSFDIAVGDSAPVLANHFSGTIFDVRIINGTISNEQIFDLYNDDKDIYQRKDILELQKLSNSTFIGNPTMSTESPKLSASECMELATERGLYDEINKIEDYTFVCQFPFDVIIPMNSNLLWIETLSLENAPYHSIRSVDNLFSTGSMTSAAMGFYSDTFKHGVYEYYDDFDESLTGKIILTNPTNNINIPEVGASPGCEINYSCFDTFAAQNSIGQEIIWQNTDTVTHSITSGTPAEGPSGVFDSGLLETYEYFSHTFDTVGTYDYFCMVHPWMQGMVVVGET